MKQIYKQPTLTVKEFSAADVLTLSIENEDTYFNLNWVTGEDNNVGEGF